MGLFKYHSTKCFKSGITTFYPQIEASHNTSPTLITVYQFLTYFIVELFDEHVSKMALEDLSSSQL